MLQLPRRVFHTLLARRALRVLVSLLNRNHLGVIPQTDNLLCDDVDHLALAHHLLQLLEGHAKTFKQRAVAQNFKQLGDRHAVSLV